MLCHFHSLRLCQRSPKHTKSAHFTHFTCIIGTRSAGMAKFSLFTQKLLFACVTITTKHHLLCAQTTFVWQNNKYSSGESESDISDNESIFSDEEDQSRKERNVKQDIEDLEDLQFILTSVTNIKNDRWDHGHLDWDNRVTLLQHEGSFEKNAPSNCKHMGSLCRSLSPYFSMWILTAGVQS